MDTDQINKLRKRLHVSNLDYVKQNLRQFKYQNEEVPYVRKWITEKEQELRDKAEKQKPTESKADNNTNAIRNIISKLSPVRIMEGIIIGVSIACCLYFIYLCFGVHLR